MPATCRTWRRASRRWPRARAKALAGLGWLSSEFIQEVSACAESLALCWARSDRWGQAFALHDLGAAGLSDGDREQAREVPRESLAIFRSRIGTESV